jgi:hypothetical protein
VSLAVSTFTLPARAQQIEIDGSAQRRLDQTIVLRDV